MTQRTEPGTQATVHTAVAARSPQGRHRCPVCDGAIGPEGGVATRYEGMTLVFRAAGCRASFEREPERYLRADALPAYGCDESPASEWCCDR